MAENRERQGLNLQNDCNGWGLALAFLTLKSRGYGMAFRDEKQSDCMAASILQIQLLRVVHAAVKNA
jgi:hypothetical protein